MLSDLLFSAFSKPESSAALIGALVGALASLLTTLLTGLMSRDKFKREALWAKRQEACNAILSRLRASDRFANSIDEGFAEDAHGYHGSEHLERANDLYWQELSASDEAFYTNYLLLPPRFRRRYERLQEERYNAQFETGPDAYLSPIYAGRSAKSDLFALALIELGIAPFWQRVGLRTKLVWLAGRTAMLRLCERARYRWRRFRKIDDEW